MRDLKNRRCLITGAAGGIGRALAHEFARAGARLLLVDVQATALESVARECTELGAWAQPLVCDLTSAERISELTASVLQTWGGVDLLVNNAGIAFYGPTESMTAAQWQRLLQINLHAPIQLTRELLPAMLERRFGHILNICSVSGLVAGGRFTAYHVSKYGLIGFTEALRAEYNRRGIGVTALCPGPVATNLYAAAESGRSDRAVPEPPRWLCASPERVARIGLRAVRRNRGMVLITPLAQVLWRIKRFTPWLLEVLNSASKRWLKPRYWFAAEPSATNDPPVAISLKSSEKSVVPAPHAAFGPTTASTAVMSTRRDAV